MYRLCFDLTADELQELRKREAEQKVDADWEIDAFMTADTVQGKKEAIVSEYILRILGLEVSSHMLLCSTCHTSICACCATHCLKECGWHHILPAWLKQCVLRCAKIVMALHQDRINLRRWCAYARNTQHAS